MEIDELHLIRQSTLRMLLVAMTAKELSAKTGIAQSSLSRMLKELGTEGAKNIGEKVARKIEAAVGKPYGWMDADKMVDIHLENPTPFAIELEDNPAFPAVRRVSVKAQAGITGYAVENCEDGAPIVFRADWYKTHNYRPERLMALRVAGESMVPSLWPDDLIVVNTESTTPKDGVAFLVAYYGEVAVKRLVMDAGQWWLSSDNADQRRHPRKMCDDSTVLIGEVIYKQSERV